MIKEQIKAAIGMPSAPADGAGPSSALAAAPAQPEAEAGQAGGSGGGGECVQDLGVITGKRVRPSTAGEVLATARCGQGALACMRTRPAPQQPRLPLVRPALAYSTSWCTL